MTEIIAADPTRTDRAPSDVLRLAVGVVVLLVVIAVGALAGDTVVEVSADLLRGLDRLPSWLVTALVAVAHLAALVLVALTIVTAARHRSVRLIVVALVAGAVAAAIAGGLSALVEAQAPPVTGTDSVLGLGSDQAWSTWALAAIAAVVSTIGPWQPRRGRRIAWAVLVSVAVVHFLATPVSHDTLIAVLVGWVVGTAVTVLTGSPSHRPTGAAIAEGLASVGIPLAKLEQASLDARGSTPYFGTMDDGDALFVKALGADERSADVMFRVYRRLQPHDLGDEKSFSTLRRAVEHEALVALAARDLGIRTPRLRAFARAEPDGFVLAYDAIAGRSLDRLDPAEVTDMTLDGVWSLVAELRGHGIAHRDLRLANVFVADDGEAWLIDFGFSELAASSTLLAGDVAELMASSAPVVGPERAVAAAVRGVGPEATNAAVARLKLPMLSGASRTALKADPACLPALLGQIEAQTT